MKYDVVYYKNGKRFIRIGDFDTIEEAEELKEAAIQGWQIEHFVEEHKEPKETIKGRLLDGAVFAVEMLIVATTCGYGRRN